MTDKGKIISLILIVADLLLFNQEQKDDLSKFLDNIKQKILEFQRLYAGRTKKTPEEMKEKEKRKKQIRKKLIQKLSLPYTFQNQHFVIEYKRKEDLKTENPKNRDLENHKYNPSNFNPLSSIIPRKNPFLSPFSFSSFQQFLKYGLMSQKSLSDRRDYLRDQNTQINESFVSIWNIRDWYLEVLTQIEKFWLFVKKVFVEDPKGRHIFSTVVCNGFPPDYLFDWVGAPIAPLAKGYWTEERKSIMITIYSYLGMSPDTLKNKPLDRSNLCLNLAILNSSEPGKLASSIFYGLNGVYSCLFGEIEKCSSSPNMFERIKKAVIIDNAFFQHYIKKMNKIFKQITKVLIENLFPIEKKENEERDKLEKFLIYKYIYEKYIQFLGAHLFTILEKEKTLFKKCDFSEYEKLDNKLRDFIKKNIPATLYFEFAGVKDILIGTDKYSVVEAREYNRMLGRIAEFDRAIFDKIFDEFLSRISEGISSIIDYNISKIKGRLEQKDFKCYLNAMGDIILRLDDSKLFNKIVAEIGEGFVNTAVFYYLRGPDISFLKDVSGLSAPFSYPSRTIQEKLEFLWRLFSSEQSPVFLIADYVFFINKTVFDTLKSKLGSFFHDESDILKEMMIIGEKMPDGRHIREEDGIFFLCLLKNNGDDLKKCLGEVYKDRENFKLFVKILDNTGIQNVSLNNFLLFLNNLDKGIEGKGFFDIMGFSWCCTSECIEKGIFCNEALCKNLEKYKLYCPPKDDMKPWENTEKKCLFFFIPNTYCSNGPTGFEGWDCCGDALQTIKDAINPSQIFCQYSSTILNCCNNCQQCDGILAKLFCSVDKLCELLRKSVKFCPDISGENPSCSIVDFAQSRCATSCSADEDKECKEFLERLNTSLNPPVSPAKIFCKSIENVNTCCKSCVKCEGVSYLTCNKRFTSVVEERKKVEEKIRNAIGLTYFQYLKQKLIR
ncbi:MAG: hypothetical protein ACK4NF_02600 [Planctomycetota bacterium]